MSWETYSPRWAPHIEGTFESPKVDPATGMPEAQKVKAKCTQCGDEWQTMCSSGRSREHIATFATLHVHRDVFEDPIKLRNDPP